MVSPFVNIFDIISLFAAELEEPKIGMWGKGLTQMNFTPLSKAAFENIEGRMNLVNKLWFFYL